MLHCRAMKRVTSKEINPATWNPLATAGRGMRRNQREVALPTASRDNSSGKFQCATLLKFGTHYYREPPTPAGGGSTKIMKTDH